MNRAVLFAIWIFVRYFHHFSAEKIDLGDYKYPALILYLPNELHGTACPASTEHEIKFNKEVSISGHGLFLRNIHNKNETLISNICDKPFEPVMLYNLKNRKYDIGFELYYEEGRIQLEASEYFQYKLVGINNEIINSTKSLGQYVVDSKDSNSTKFHFTDGSPTLIFHWVSKLPFKYSAHTKQTRISMPNIPLQTNAQIKCPNHGFSIQDMKVHLFSNSDENHLELWKDQHSYGQMELSQIIPARFFTEPSAILASCRHMNLVPIWKSIVDGQLRKVDLYLQAVIKAITWNQVFGQDHVWSIDKLNFGVNGVLEDPTNKRKMYFCDAENRRQIAIPKIIYRIIEGNKTQGACNAIIVIHNDPTRVSDSDRVCSKDDEVPSWERIKNDDPRTGLTYVCHYHFKKVSPSDNFNLDSEDLVSLPLRLDMMPHAFPDDPYIDVRFSHVDAREEISNHFDSDPK